MKFGVGPSRKDPLLDLSLRALCAHFSLGEEANDRAVILNRISQSAAAGKSQRPLPQSSSILGARRHQSAEVPSADRNCAIAVRQRISYRFAEHCDRIKPFVSFFAFVQIFCRHVFG